MATDRPYDPNDPSTWQLDPSEPTPASGRNALLRGLEGGTLYDTTTGQTYDPSQNATDPNLPPLPSDLQTATGGYDPTGASSGQPDTSNGTDPAADPTARTTSPSARHGGTSDSGGTDSAGNVGQPLPPAPAPAPPPPAQYLPPPITVGGDTTAFNAQLRQFLLSQLGDLSTPTDETSADIRPSITAYRNQSTRDQQAMRDAEAERFYAMGGEGGAGLGSGAFDTALRQDAEAAAGSRANFTGSLVYNANQAKRQQLQAMLQTAVNAGQTDAAQQIQAQIAGIDAQLRSQGLTNANQNFNDSLAARYAELKAQMNRDQILQALGG